MGQVRGHRATADEGQMKALGSAPGGQEADRQGAVEANVDGLEATVGKPNAHLQGGSASSHESGKLVDAQEGPAGAVAAPIRHPPDPLLTVLTYTSATPLFRPEADELVEDGPLR